MNRYLLAAAFAGAALWWLDRQENLLAANKPDDDETYRDFRQNVNMSPSQIEKWMKDPRAKEASYERTRRELKLIAKMKRTPKSNWTDAMRDKASRLNAFVARHRAQGEQQASGGERFHCTRKRVIALRNWGHQPPECGVPER